MSPLLFFLALSAVWHTAFAVAFILSPPLSSIVVILPGTSTPLFLRPIDFEANEFLAFFSTGLASLSPPPTSLRDSFSALQFFFCVGTLAALPLFFSPTVSLYFTASVRFLRTSSVPVSSFLSLPALGCAFGGKDLPLIVPTVPPQLILTIVSFFCPVSGWLIAPRAWETPPPMDNWLVFPLFSAPQDSVFLFANEGLFTSSRRRKPSRYPTTSCHNPSSYPP